MNFRFDARPSDSPLVETVWRTCSEGGGSFISPAEAHWGMVVTRQKGKTILTVRGPETKAMPAPIPENAEFFGIIFKLGTFMPHLPTRNLVDEEIHLPDATSRSVWLASSAWELPTFENADTFIQRLVHNGLLVRDEIVDAALQGHLDRVSLRSVQRRFLRVTGLTQNHIRQIERARYALSLLQQGLPILSAVDQAGYFDQSHLTRSLKHFTGQTPAQIARQSQTE